MRLFVQFTLQRKTTLMIVNKDNMSASAHQKENRKKALYEFQKGIILSCHSLLGLFDILKDFHNIDFIMTRRLNQDCLEHFFGCI